MQSDGFQFEVQLDRQALWACLRGGSWVLSAPRWLFIDGVRRRTGAFPGGVIEAVALRTDVPIGTCTGEGALSPVPGDADALGGGGAR